MSDISKIGRILTTVIAVFNLNSAQQTQLNSYVRLEQDQWIEKRKDDSEIEQLINSKANEISK